MHASDCATNNGPALPVGPCDCGGVIPAPVAPDMPARTVALLARIAALEAALAPFAKAAHRECKAANRHGVVRAPNWSVSIVVDAKDLDAATAAMKI